MLYVLAPFIGWLTSGTLKFLLNYLRYGKAARQKVGNGGFPSTHTTVMVTSVFLIGFHAGFNQPVFGLGVAITFIIIIDATGLRRAVGKHAARLNQIAQDTHTTPTDSPVPSLRESMGHTKMEILGGIGLGVLLAWLLHQASLLYPGLLG